MITTRNIEKAIRFVVKVAISQAAKLRRALGKTTHTGRGRRSRGGKKASATTGVKGARVKLRVRQNIISDGETNGVGEQPRPCPAVN